MGEDLVVRESGRRQYDVLNKLEIRYQERIPQLSTHLAITCANNITQKVCCVVLKEHFNHPCVMYKIRMDKWKYTSFPVICCEMQHWQHKTIVTLSIFYGICFKLIQHGFFTMIRPHCLKDGWVGLQTIWCCILSWINHDYEVQ